MDMTNDHIDEIVLRVLSGQHPDYLIHEDATAFVVEGLTTDLVKLSLQRLEAAGYARLDEVVAMEYELEPVMQQKRDTDGKAVWDDNRQPVLEPVLDADGNPLMRQVTGVDGKPVLVESKDAAGNPVVLVEGWACTDAGHANAIKHAAVPNPEKLAGALVQAIVRADTFEHAKQGLKAIEGELAS